MAYGVRYSCEWRSPMREQSLYQIDILEKDYTGEVESIYPTGDVLVISQGKIDDGEFVALKPSEATLTLLCKDEGEPYTSLFTTDPMRYKVQVMKASRASMRQFLYWEGYLDMGSYSQEWANPPYRVTLRAYDGLTLLKNMPWLDADGNRFEGVMSMGAIIEDVIARVSTYRVRYPYPIENIMPGQTEKSIYLIGVEAKGVYSQLGKDDEAPSCYDVLNSVLVSLQLQLFQSYGSWSVRSLASLVTSKRPASVSSDINNLYNDIAIVPGTDDGVGMSTSAILSLLPPYKALKVSRPNAGEIGDEVPSLLEQKRWHGMWSTYGLSTKKPDADSLRLAVYNLGESSPKGCAYVFDGILEQSITTSVTVSVDAYNLAGQDVNVKAALMLVREDQDPIASWDYSDLANVDDVAVWNNGWQPLSSLPKNNNNQVKRSELLNVMQEVVLAASPRYVLFDTIVPYESLTATTISLTADMLSSGIGDRYRLILFLAGNSGVPEMELHAPTISFETGVAVSTASMYSDSIVNTSGVGELVFDQEFADTWMLPATGTAFAAPLINIAKGSTLRGVVAPAQRQLIADVACSAARHLRGVAVRQLDGEVYVKTDIDLDAMWVDSDGRKYYTNYVRRLLRRGLYSVQLREIPAISVSKKPKATFSKDISSLVGMDTSAMWLSLNGRNLYRYDADTDTITLVMSSPTGTYALTLNEGQRCACVVAFDGTYYSLRAYDTHGEILSDISKAQTNVDVFDTALLDIVMRTARFDANTMTWTLVGGNNKVTYLSTLAVDGRNLDSSTYTIASYCNAEDFTLIPNGFAYTGRTVVGGSLYYGYWHNHAHQPLGTIALLGSYRHIVACNEIYVLICDSRGYNLHYRTDTALGYDSTPLLYFKSPYQLVAMNNALVLYRNSTGYGAYVYDGRSGNTITLSAPLALADTVLWLSSDKVYGAWVDKSGGYHITSEIIINGTGTAAATIEEEDI